MENLAVFDSANQTQSVVKVLNVIISSKLLHHFMILTVPKPEIVEKFYRIWNLLNNFVDFWWNFANCRETKEELNQFSALLCKIGAQKVNLMIQLKLMDIARHVIDFSFPRLSNFTFSRWWHHASFEIWCREIYACEHLRCISNLECNTRSVGTSCRSWLSSFHHKTELGESWNLPDFYFWI